MWKKPSVSRAVYYKWLQRKPTARELENVTILQDIQAIYAQVDAFLANEV